MKPDYSPRYYQRVITHADQITDFLNDLHETQLNMIDQALELSDLREARAVLDHIRAL